MYKTLCALFKHIKISINKVFFSHTCPLTVIPFSNSLVSSHPRHQGAWTAEHEAVQQVLVQQVLVQQVLVQITQSS